MGPSRGDIAICSAGFIGMLTADKPKEINYPDGNKGVAYVGIHLSPGMVGKPWSSRNPRIVGDIKEYLAILAARGVRTGVEL